MAGKSHDYTMNINVKSQADGVSKTNSELNKLQQTVKQVDGQKIQIKVDMGGLEKQIGALTSQMSAFNQGLNINSKGFLSAAQDAGVLGKSMMDTGNQAGSLQKQLDSINGKGFQDAASSASSLAKAETDAASQAGSVVSTIDSINTGAIEDAASAFGDMAKAAQDAGSSASDATSTSMPNWSNSYGGRYGGMRYTGQEIGLSSIVSALSGGKTSYELTIDNAQTKQRNKALMSAWPSETGNPGAGMAAYWEFDQQTDRNLVTLNSVGVAANAFQAETNSSAEAMKKFAGTFTKFGTMVVGQGWNESVAQTAMMKLGRGLHGSFAALDQYGITSTSLQNVRDENGKQVWNGDENDAEGYMKAVDYYASRAYDNLLGTMTGQQALLSKQMSLGGYALGEYEAEALAPAMRTLASVDSGIRSWTKSMGWGATEKTASGNTVYQRVKTDSQGNEVYQKDESGEVVKNPITGAPLKEYEYASVEDEGYAEDYDWEGNGWSEKKLGFDLFTGLIGADQAVGTYKTIKDTVLATVAEIKDLQRLRKVGLKGIFGDSNYDVIDGHLVQTRKNLEDMQKMCPGDDCPKTGGSSSSNNSNKNKKRSRRQRIKDRAKGIGQGIKNKISDGVGNVKTGINNKFKRNNRIGDKFEPANSNKKKMNSFLHPNAQKGMGLLEKNFANAINSQKNAGNNLNTIPSKSTPMIPTEHMPPRDASYKTPSGQRLRKPAAKVKERNKNYATRSRGSMNRSYRRTLTANQGKLPVGTAMNPLRNNPSITQNSPKSIPSQNRRINGRRKGVDYTDTLGKRTSLNPKNDVLAQQRKDIAKYGKDTNYGKRLLKEAKLRKQREINPKNLSGTSSFFDRMDKASNNSKATRSAKRSNYANKYNGYMKNIRKGMYDVKDLKNRAGEYIDTKKKLAKSEYDKGMLHGDKLKESWGTKGRAAPYKAWSKTKEGLGNIGTRLNDSVVGNQYRSLKRQGAYVKDSVTGSRAWQTASSQVKGNAGAMMGMFGNTRAGQAVKNTRVGKAVANAKKNGFGKTARSGLGKVAGGAKAVGGAALSGVSKGMSSIASGAGKAVGAVGAISGAFTSILGPIGAVIMGVTLITGLLDAMGVDWMGPLQTAFGGAIEAFQPLIQGFGQWMADTATAIAPYITSFAEWIAPILGSIGELLGGGLSSLGQVLLPIFEGIGQLFSGEGVGDFISSLIDGLSSLAPLLNPIVGLFDLITNGDGSGLFEGLEGIQPILDTLGSLLSGGGEVISGMLSGLVSSVGGAFAGVFGTIWGMFTSGIESVITTLSSGFIDVITSIGDTLQGIIDSIVEGIQTVIDSLTAGFQTISDTLTTIGDTVSDLVLKFGELGAAVTGFFFAVLNGKFDEIKTKLDEIKTSATGLGEQFTTMASSVTTMQSGWTSIQNSVMMVSTSILQVIASLSQMGTLLSSIAPVIASTMAQSLAVIQQFGSSAIQVMASTATGMSSAFASNLNIASATNAEMAGAYAALCSWGALIVAKAGQIAADATANYEAKSGIGSPGYIWRMTDAEFLGTLRALTKTGGHLVSEAGNIAKGMVSSWMSEHEGVNYNPLNNVQNNIPSSLSLPKTNVSFDTASFTKSTVPDVPVEPPLPLVDLPTVQEPKLSKEIRVKNQQQGNVPPVYNFNHYGDIDNEERANKVIKYFSKKMSFENKRANRTV